MAQEPIVEARLSSDEAIWVGQNATMIVELKVPGFFSGTPAFDLPEVPGLILIPPRDRPVLNSENIDGTSYTVQRHELGVYARSGGEQTIPSFRVRLGYKVSPVDKEVVSTSVMTSLIPLNVQVPEGAEQLGNVISARDLEVTDSWSTDTNQVQVGDALVRTIRFSAADIPSIAFPEFPSPDMDGISIYRDEPDLMDKNERGESRGERTDHLTYVCEKIGEFSVPPVTLTWFDLGSEQLKTTTFETRTLRVVENPKLSEISTAPPVGATEENGDVARILVWFMGGVVVLMAAYRLGWMRWIPGYLKRYRPLRLAPFKPPAKGR